MTKHARPSVGNFDKVTDGRGLGRPGQIMPFRSTQSRSTLLKLNRIISAERLKPRVSPFGQDIAPTASNDPLPKGGWALRLVGNRKRLCRFISPLFAAKVLFRSIGGSSEVRVRAGRLLASALTSCSYKSVYPALAFFERGKRCFQYFVPAPPILS